MKPAEKTAGIIFIFFFAVVIAFPINADPHNEDEPVHAEELFPDDDPDGESLLAEEPVYDEVLFSDDEFPPDEDLFPEEESLDEEPLFEEYLFEEDPFPEKERFPGENSLIFEAPPLIFEVPLFIHEPRSFDDIFPDLSFDQKITAFSEEGLRYFFEKDGDPVLLPDPDSGIDLLSSVMEKDPSHIIEALAVVPYNEREFDMLDIFNAMGRIGNIRDYTLPVNDRVFIIFMESSRIESARIRKDIPDPPPADELPHSETMFLRFKDATLGNLYMRADISMSLYGITYTMTNFASVRYFLFPLMRSERFITIIYLEPVTEGVLVYSLCGFYIPGFIAGRVNLTPNINRRISVLINWITGGLRIQE